VSYANLWGRDHQASYQYITSNKPHVFKAHGLDYRVPLPWRHYVQLSASYFHAQPELLDGLFLQDGETFTSDLRYTIPLRTGDNPIDVYTAVSFKESNNNLTWDPHFTNIALPGITTDIFQLTTGASAVRRDKYGAWGFGANLTWSPGRVNTRNSELAFQESRAGAEPRYAYASFSVQRLLNLRHGWDLSSRAVLQIADGNLLATEQLSIGGGSSVRGFRENVFAGDEGFVFTTDLLTPALKYQVPRLSQRRGPLETRFLVFYDAANSRSKQSFITDPKRKPLASAGVGVRMSLATNFSLVADYGWQLTRLPYEVAEHSRGHIRVTFAY
jgi:hemolysin activation/secretion protein